jgi:hypothetical protein
MTLILLALLIFLGFLPRPASDQDPPISASWVAWITDVCHHTMPYRVCLTQWIKAKQIVLCNVWASSSQLKASRGKTGLQGRGNLSAAQTCPCFSSSGCVCVCGLCVIGSASLGNPNASVMLNCLSQKAHELPPKVKTAVRKESR